MIVAGLLLLGVETLAEMKVQPFDFNGMWKLDRTENLEEYMQASGTSWWKRKLAKFGSSRMRQTIKHEGIRFEIESENPVENRSEIIIADGVTERDVETAAGDMMSWTARIEDNRLVVDGHGDLGHRIIYRENVEAWMVVTILNPDADTQCKLFFKRAEPG